MLISAAHTKQKQHPHMTFATFLRSLLFLAIGSAGGGLASLFPVPLPFLLGALCATAIAVATLPETIKGGFKIPDTLRLPFIACIGLLIGAQIHLELIANWGLLAGILIAVTVFTPMAHAMSYAIMWRIGGYDRTTAFFAGAPGGLIEALTLGEAAGSSIPILTVQQFLRIIFVVTLVPLMISLWVGHPVGSAAGFSQTQTAGLSPIWIIIAFGAMGLALAKITRMPAGQLIGPMLVAGLASSTGLYPLALPTWMILVSQVVIGTALGLRFNGMSFGVLRRGVAMALLSTSAMLCLAVALTWAVIQTVGAAPIPTLLSFTPGGVTEVSLIALSLGADAALITIAHVYRITLTVAILGVFGKRFIKPQQDAP